MKNKAIIWLCVITLLVGMSEPVMAKKKVSLTKKKLTMAVGEKVTLKVKGAVKKVKWSSNKKKIAQVNKKGVVKGKRKGQAKITAKTGKYKLVCKVTVYEKENNEAKADNVINNVQPALQGTPVPQRNYTPRPKVNATDSPKATVSPKATKAPDTFQTAGPKETPAPGSTDKPGVPTQEPGEDVTPTKAPDSLLDKPTDPDKDNGWVPGWY